MTVNAEYTWYHHKQFQTVAHSSLADGWQTNDWFPTTFGGFHYPNLSSEWVLHMDLVDLVAGRPVYEGRAVTVAPVLGLRALWLRQQENITASVGGANAFSNSGSNSWALGVVAKSNAKWMFGKIFRIDGEFGASLLYTQYTSIYNTFQALDGLPAYSKVSNVRALRPTMDFGLGVGLGDYFFSEKIFLDLSVRYDLNYFWSQNMMRNFVTQLIAYNDAIGDLVLHGLTVNLKCDF